VADRLETAADARLQLRLPDGAVINISSGSAIRISQYAYTRSSMRRTAVVNLLQGSARFYLQDPWEVHANKTMQSAGNRQNVRTKLPEREGSRFIIETDQAMVETGEADVVVEADAGKSTIYTLGGSVSVRNRSDLVVGVSSVEENLSVIVRPKAAPTDPAIIPEQQRRRLTRYARNF
jgi:ferric-dicitrate binding protein FerR (iron transport regulator)